MKNLYVFGDSFTAGNGCLREDEYYVKYKTDDCDKIWCEIVANYLDFNLINNGCGLYSNDKIIDSVINEFDYFDNDDIILIQKTFYHRFDIPNLDDTMLITLSPEVLNFLIGFHGQKYTKDERKHLEYFSVIFNSHLYEKRQCLRFDFLKKTIENKKIKCFVWDINDLNIDVETIISATKGKISDYHWSFNGHKNAAKKIIKLIDCE